VREHNVKIWTLYEAESWEISVPPAQTRREVKFLTWSFGRFSSGAVRHVLDLGCGTGRLALEMASRGYTVTGVDRFPTMLRRARANARAAGLTIALKEASLEELEIGGRYDAAYSVCSVFNYILEGEALSRCLERLRNLIRPGGLLVVDVMNFASLLGIWKKETVLRRRGMGWRLERRVTHEVDEVKMLHYHRELNTMTRGKEMRGWRETHVLRMWTFPELRQAMEAHGFPQVHVFGQMKAGAREATTRAARLAIVAARA
jgi:2-polyprenyl-3-methyl-5-hydroxy-6-metoxy-1,4-benzoquinol methylase